MNSENIAEKYYNNKTTDTVLAGLLLAESVSFMYRRTAAAKYI